MMITRWCVMVFLALVTIVLAMMLVVITWTAVRETTPGDPAGPADAGSTRPAARPETPEGALVRQLLDDRISGRQYRHAMRRLAERDADRHPLPMPPES
jgi:hypothetical protein